MKQLHLRGVELENQEKCFLHQVNSAFQSKGIPQHWGFTGHCSADLYASVKEAKAWTKPE